MRVIRSALRSSSSWPVTLPQGVDRRGFMLFASSSAFQAVNDSVFVFGAVLGMNRSSAVVASSRTIQSQCSQRGPGVGVGGLGGLGRTAGRRRSTGQGSSPGRSGAGVAARDRSRAARWASMVTAAINTIGQGRRLDAVVEALGSPTLIADLEAITTPPTRHGSPCRFTERNAAHHRGGDGVQH